MNADPARRRATYADLEAAPEHLVAELIGGELVTHPRPRPRHGIATAELSAELGPKFGRGRNGPGGWLFIDEPQLALGEDVVVPDLAGWRLPRATFDIDEVNVEVAPDWVCEVLSPSTEHYDRGAKRWIYANAGIAHLWLLDPRAKLLEAFQLTGGKWLLLGAVTHADDVSLPPFDAISFPLANLFPLDPPPQV